jgi:hypothetical protein
VGAELNRNRAEEHYTSLLRIGDSIIRFPIPLSDRHSACFFWIGLGGRAVAIGRDVTGQRSIVKSAPDASVCRGYFNTKTTACEHCQNLTIRSHRTATPGVFGVGPRHNCSMPLLDEPLPLVLKSRQASAPAFRIQRSGCGWRWQAQELVSRQSELRVSRRLALAPLVAIFLFISCDLPSSGRHYSPIHHHPSPVSQASIFSST